MKKVIILLSIIASVELVVAQATTHYTRGNYIKKENNRYQLVVPSNDRFASEGILIDLGRTKTEAVSSLRAIEQKINGAKDEELISVGEMKFKVRKWEQDQEIYADMMTPSKDSKTLYIIQLSQVRKCIRQIK